MKKTKVYIAGPMSGLPQFNFPAFHEAAAILRNDCGYEVVSPAETDPPESQAAAMASPDGKPDASGKVGVETWGDALARDVKMLADDGITDIVFLPGWQNSKGARLEAFVGLLVGLKFWRLDNTYASWTAPLSRAYVATQLVSSFFKD